MPERPDIRPIWADMGIDERLAAFVEHHADRCRMQESEQHRGYHNALADVLYYVVEGNLLPPELEDESEEETGRRDIIAIRLYEPETECVVCGAVTFLRQGIPMYEGQVLPRDHEGEWAGFHTCRRCFDLWEAGDYALLQATLDAPRGEVAHGR